MLIVAMAPKKVNITVPVDIGVCGPMDGARQLSRQDFVQRESRIRAPGRLRPIYPIVVCSRPDNIVVAIVINIIYYCIRNL